MRLYTVLLFLSDIWINMMYFTIIFVLGCFKGIELKITRQSRTQMTLIPNNPLTMKKSHFFQLELNIVLSKFDLL